MKEKKFCYLTDSSQRLDALTELCQRLTRFSKVFIYRNFNQSKYKNTKYESYPIKLQCSSPVNFQSTQSNGNLCRPPESWVLELHETIHILHFGSNALVITIELLTHSLLSLYMSLYVELCKVFLILLDLCSFIQIRSQKQKFIFKSFAQVPRLKVCVCVCVCIHRHVLEFSIPRRKYPYHYFQSVDLSFSLLFCLALLQTIILCPSYVMNRPYRSFVIQCVWIPSCLYFFICIFFLVC